MSNKVHWLFWMISLLGLLWNLGGAINYLMQLKPDYVAALPETHQAIVIGRPIWATGGFAIGVFGGTFACVLLVLRKQLAGFVFMVSLMGIFITMIHSLQVVVANQSFSVTEIAVMVILPIVVANLLIGFTFYAIKRGWLS